MRRIDRVTVTGADDSVEVGALVEIQEKYPFVEWGILLSIGNEGINRFPSVQWIDGLIKAKENLTLSGHLCGKWVRDICAGRQTLYEDRPQFKSIFGRYQLNFHSYLHQIKDRTAFINAVDALAVEQVILQFDDVNNDMLASVRDANIDAVPLFDTSGGAGVLPGEWPKALNVYSGYAGGLSPENLGEQMALIGEVCGNGPIWIDAETMLRSNHDSVFDLEKVCAFLDAAKPFMAFSTMTKEEGLDYCYKNREEYIRDSNDIGDAIRQFDCLVELLESSAIAPKDLPDYGMDY